MTNFADVGAWLHGADMGELIHAKEALDRALQAKKDEDRIPALRVEACGLIVAYFRHGEEAKALEYLLQHREEVAGEAICIRPVRLLQSEAEADLALRWW
ncbi:hypothetical protein [Xanthomonas cannabis]|uniref:hypothetical protein n=1 Tax=Xanthomonas cannabis TaxID=1885674 RepID=UPI00141BA9A4|nr:hypothetical protein [Xanthomonas cannabis]NIK62607.1 hypothetical protein [Xanthomonas cannabis]